MTSAGGAATRRIGLLAVLGVGVGLRVFRLDWGLPAFSVPDDTIHFIRPAMAAAAGGRLEPADFVHPPVLFFVLTAAFRLWSAMTGRTILVAGPAAAEHLAALTLLARGVIVASAGLSILACYLLARRLLGERAGLLAAAGFAAAPLHVLESHRVAPDVVVILFTLLAAHAVLIGREEQRTMPLVAGFTAAGLAAATKYTGVFAATAPAWMVVRPEGDSSRSRSRLLALGALLAGLAFGLGCLPCWLRFDTFTRHLRMVGYFTYIAGGPGVDLAAGWPQHRYVFPLLVTLPYLAGWPLYLAALVGLGLLWRRDRRVAVVLLAAIVPYLLFLGGANSAVPRYYLILTPFLAMAAGAALDAARGPGGRIVAGAVLGYSVLLSASQVARLGVGPQTEVGALVERLAAEAAREGRGTLVVAYPNHFALAYDAVRPFLHDAKVKIVDFPDPFGHLGAEAAAGSNWSGDGRAGLEARGVDVVVLPSLVENAVRRARPDGPTGRFFAQLEAGEIGFRPVAHFRTHFLTERLYTWGDPMLDTHWETAIAGYKVFVRAGLSIPGGPP